MTDLATILATAEPVAGGFRATVPAGWMQGRTAYGGWSSALALHAAQAADADLPPLRSATINFIGPLAGPVSVTATLLRRGRNAAFVQADIAGEAGLGFRATFAFMAARPSAIDHDRRAPASATPPGADAAVLVGPADFFLGNFEMVDPGDDADPAGWRRWVRLRARHGLAPATELVAVADALPPAALKLHGTRAPISSMTWLLNLLEPDPATENGWWLLGATTDQAQAGGSSQTMRLWNARGMLVAEGMQSVGIFI